MRRWFVGLCAVGLTACPSGDVVGDETTSATDGTTGGSMSTSTSSSASGSSTASGSNTDSGTTDGTTGTTEGASESTSLDGSTADTGTTMAIAETSSTTEIDPSATTVVTEDTGGLLGNGEACDASDQCASGFCYLAGVLGGICGECIDDDDCFYGCNPPNPLAMPPVGSYCNDGGIGAGCETSEACQMDLVCTEVLNVPGIIAISGCSECSADADCPELCSPNLDTIFTGFEGHWECVDAGSQPLGAGCDFEGTGNDACASGYCGVADVMGILQLGICSDCVVDDDCAGGTCMAPQVEVDGMVTPGMCV